MQSGIKIECGVDEVGRGPLVGPVVACALILPEKFEDIGLNDSKKLSPKRRALIFDLLDCDPEVHYSISFVHAKEIDQINILQASLLAMKNAINALEVVPQKALIDGRYAPAVNIECATIIKGDQKEKSIAAASIMAKVVRDRWMLDLHQQFPYYGYDKHKGYPTRLHLQAIKEYGINEHYRKSFAPIRALFQEIKL